MYNLGRDPESRRAVVGSEDVEAVEERQPSLAVHHFQVV